MERADQLRHDGEPERMVSKKRFQLTFRPESRACNQIHVHAGFLAQAQHGRNGVFLSAPYD
jgi:hypothetical protein